MKRASSITGVTEIFYEQTKALPKSTSACSLGTKLWDLWNFSGYRTSIHCKYALKVFHLLSVQVLLGAMRGLAEAGKYNMGIFLMDLRVEELWSGIWQELFLLSMLQLNP